MFRELIEAGRILVAKLERYRHRTVADIPREERLATAEIGAWFDAARTLIQETCGKGSKEMRKWKSTQRKLGKIAEKETYDGSWNEAASAIAWLHKSMGLLTEFDLYAASRKSMTPGPATTDAATPEGKMGKQKLFIVHGRNHAIRDQIQLFLMNNFGLNVTVMEAGAHGGRTLSEKFEEMARDCDFAVFILSADDHLIDRTSDKRIKRARQNVVLEVGFFWGMLGRRGKVAFLVERDPEMELPTDIEGLGWIPITRDLAETKLKLQQELKAAKII